MKQKLLIIGALAMLTGLLSGSEWPLAEISVETAKPNDLIQKLAGEEMEKHLKLIAGERKPGSAYTFRIGTPAPGQENDKLDIAEARYAVRGKTVYLWGDDFVKEDHSEIFLSQGETRCGSMSAVYAFLENELGVRWLRPGDAGIAYETRNTLNLPESRDFKWAMEYAMTGVRVYWWRQLRNQRLSPLTPEALRLSDEYLKQRQYDDHLWSRRMRHGKRIVFRYGHAFGAWLEKYGKTHPEYLGLDINGKRGLPEELRSRVKLCLSNPEVVDVIIREWVEAGKPEYMNVCPNDGTPGFCRCEKCQELDTRRPGENFLDHLTDRYLWFWNQIAAKAVKLRSDVKLVTYVYSYYRHPPRREKVEYPDNMLLGMVPQMFEDNAKFFAAWAEAGAKNIFLRPNDLCGYMPLNRGLEKRIYDKFQASRRFHIHGTDYDGCCGVRNIDLEYYIAARMMHVPDKPFDELAGEYYSAYGAAAPEVKQYYEHWRGIGERSLNTVKENLKKENRQLSDAGRLSIEVNRNIAQYMRNEDFRKSAEILQAGLKKELTPQTRQLLDELVIIDHHSLLTWKFVDAANRKKSGQPNQLEEISRNLIEYRVKNKNLIGWNWPELFGHPRGEQLLWPEVEWYRQEVLHEVKKEQPKSNPGIVFSNDFENGKMGDWKERAAFKQVARRPDGKGYCLEFTAGSKSEIGAGRHKINVTPGSYRLKAEYCLTDKTTSIRFRVVGGSQDVLNLVEKRKDGNWQQLVRDFEVPSGTKSLVIYAIAGNGEGGSVYLDNISLERLDAKAEDAI